MDSLLDLVEEENDQVREGGGEGGREGEKERVREGRWGILSFTLLISKTCLRFNLLLPLPPSLPPSLPQIRRTAIRALPDICKYSSDPSLFTKVAEYLTQLLATGSITTHTITHSHPHTHMSGHYRFLPDDSVDLSLVKAGLASLLQKNPTHAMDGIFSQVERWGAACVGETSLDSSPLTSHTVTLSSLPCPSFFITSQPSLSLSLSSSPSFLPPSPFLSFLSFPFLPLSFCLPSPPPSLPPSGGRGG